MKHSLTSNESHSMTGDGTEVDHTVKTPSDKIWKRTEESKLENSQICGD